MENNDELAKLRHHMSLLRHQYKLTQQQLSDTARQLDQLTAEKGGVEGGRGFVGALVATVGALYNSQSFSDIDIKLADGVSFPGHRLVLATRGLLPLPLPQTLSRPQSQMGSESASALPGFDHRQLDWSSMNSAVALTVLQWVYTNSAVSLATAGDDFVLDVMRAAAALQLPDLSSTCEAALMSSVTVRNCVKFFSTADEIGAQNLKNYCSELAATHWDDFTSADFVDMPAQQVYQMAKTNSKFPLHSAVRLHREDVVFLYLLEFHSELWSRLNECDSVSHTVPLDLALSSDQSAICETLLKHGANVNATDSRGRSLLYRAADRGDERAITFLLQHGAQVNYQWPETGDTALHVLARSSSSSSSPSLSPSPSCSSSAPAAAAAAAAASCAVAVCDRWKCGATQCLLKAGADVNLTNNNNICPLQYSVMCRCEAVFQSLLQSQQCDLTLTDSSGHTILWHALAPATTATATAAAPATAPAATATTATLPSSSAVDSTAGGEFDESMAERLVQAGADVNAALPSSGESLLHLAAAKRMEQQALFLLKHGAGVNTTNTSGETALHIAAANDLWRLVGELLRCGANPNVFTWQPPSSPAVAKNVSLCPFDDDYDEGVVEAAAAAALYLQTPLHQAVAAGCLKTVEVIVQHKGWLLGQSSDLVSPNLDAADSLGQTPLSLALQLSDHQVALCLIDSGVAMDYLDKSGLSLLHRRIEARDSETALFLLNKGASVNVRTEPGHRSPLELAVAAGLVSVVDRLCQLDADMTSGSGHDPLLWQALTATGDDSSQCHHEMASVLVRHGVDVDAWSPGPGNCVRTLLHRAIDENNEPAACFLIRSGCDIISPCRAGSSNDTADKCQSSLDLMTPLHMCAKRGQENTLQALLEHDVPVNARDCDQRTALHLAIDHAYTAIISLLLSVPEADVTARDKLGQSPFMLAIVRSNNRAAQAILDREPGVAEQFDSRGRNFLHVAIERRDVESVMFLLSILVNVHSRTRDALGLVPLHLAAQVNSEIILRNLLLAGASVDEVTPLRQTALHLAAERDSTQCLSILLEHRVDFNALDCNRENALHVACREGHLASVRVLLTESEIDATATNIRRRTPLHCVAAVSRDTSAAICHLFLESMSDYPVSARDADGNTALLLAYMRGSVQLCIQLAKHGSALAVVNNEGVSIFNFPVTTKQLLYRILDSLNEQPAWSDGEVCMNCGTKFHMAFRRHHCRHCGRLLCSQCSIKQLAIVKFAINKPTRVCDVCYDVLTQTP